MRLTYNGLGLHEAGSLVIAHRSEYEGGEAPQREKVTLSARVTMFSATGSYGANYSSYQAIRTALGTQHAGLRWENEETGQVYVDQTASVVSHNLPEDPTGWGSYQFDLVVEWAYYRALTTQNMVASVTGGGAPVSLGNVTKWSEELVVERTGEDAPGRKRVAVRVQASGQILGDVRQELGARRTWLLAERAALKAACQAAEVRVAFGDFNQVLKVDRCTAEVDQAVNGVGWSWSGEYQVLPSGNYALADLTANVTDNRDGSTRLSLSGTVRGTSELVARAKWAEASAALAQSLGYGTAQVMSESATVETSDGADGGVFVRLTCQKEFRGWRADNAVPSYSSAGGRVELGQVTGWRDAGEVESADEWLAGRVGVKRRVELSGVISHANPQGTATEAKRVWLLGQRTALMAALGGGATGTVVVGPWTQAGVKVVDYSAELNAALDAVDWRLTVEWLEQPSVDWTVVRYTAEEVDGQDGEVRLTWSGSVRGRTEALGRARLAALRETVLAMLGYGSCQTLRQGATAQHVNGLDGEVVTSVDFTEEYRRWRSDNLGLVFTATGGAAVNLGEVTEFATDYVSDRFSPVRSQRRRTSGTLTARGLWRGDRAQELGARRAALLQGAERMRSAMNAADGRLVYGAGQAFNGVVRVERFTAQVNQAMSGVEWSLTAGYTLFPDEATGAVVEVNVAERSGAEDGDEILALNGQIVAPDEVVGRAKLAAVRTALLAGRGYTIHQQLRSEVTPRLVQSGDRTQGLSEGEGGITLTELTFSEEYRRRKAIVESAHLRVSEREDARTGLIQVTYSGSVAAWGGHVDGAYAAAVARATQLGDNKLPFKVGQSLEWNQRVITTAAGWEGVRLEFEYNYLRKGGAVTYLELTSETQRDAFGPDAESASGFVVAATLAAARAAYESRVKALFTGRVIRGERLSEGRMERGTGTGDQRIETRLDFQLSASVVKRAGDVGLRYEVETEEDWVEGLRNIRVSGGCWAGSVAEATVAINGLLLAMGFTNPLRTRTVEQAERQGTNSAHVGVGFERTYQRKISGATGVMECELNVGVQFSGTRWVKQDLPFAAGGAGGIAVMQACGIEAGSRSVRGRVKALDLASAVAWARSKRSLLTGDLATVAYSPGFYPTPPKEETTYSYELRSGTEVRCVTVTFDYGETLPWYPLA